MAGGYTVVTLGPILDPNGNVYTSAKVEANLDQLSAIVADKYGARQFSAHRDWGSTCPLIEITHADLSRSADKLFDGVLMHLLQAATYILPDYTQFDTTEFVASGYNIFGSLVGQQLVMALVYFTAVSIAGYFFLKTREIAA